MYILVDIIIVVFIEEEYCVIMDNKIFYNGIYDK